jgi:ribosomal protein L11
LIPVVITAYEDRSFSFVIHEPANGPGHATSLRPADAIELAQA